MNRNPNRIGTTYRIAVALFPSLVVQQLSAPASGNFTSVSASKGTLEFHVQREGSNFLVTGTDAGNAVFNMIS